MYAIGSLRTRSNRTGVTKTEMHLLRRMWLSFFIWVHPELYGHGYVLNNSGAFDTNRVLRKQFFTRTEPSLKQPKAFNARREDDPRGELDFWDITHIQVRNKALTFLRKPTRKVRLYASNLLALGISICAHIYGRASIIKQLFLCNVLTPSTRARLLRLKL